MPSEPTLPARRLRELVEHLGASVGKRRGWKAEVARAMGIHPSYVTKIVAGSVTRVSTDVIERIATRIGFERAFFFDPAVGVPDFVTGALKSEHKAGEPAVPEIPRPESYLERSSTPSRTTRCGPESTGRKLLSSREL
jgi:transcriptional regulator with XRE-family HTH domain